MISTFCFRSLRYTVQHYEVSGILRTMHTRLRLAVSGPGSCWQLEGDVLLISSGPLRVNLAPAFT